MYDFTYKSGYTNTNDSRMMVSRDCREVGMERSYYIMGTEPQIGKMKSEGWLHNNVKVFNATELRNYKCLNGRFYVTYVLKQFLKIK